MLPSGVCQSFLDSYEDEASLGDKKVRFREPYASMTNENQRDFSPSKYQHFSPKHQNLAFVRDQDTYIKQPSSAHRWATEKGIAPGMPSLFGRQQSSVGTAERWKEDLLLNTYEQLPPKIQKETSRRKQVSDEHPSGLKAESQTLLTLQSGADQEKDKKERQKQFLRYRRLFMNIEREQVKEQQRQKEFKKKVERIKKKKEQQCRAEEQRLLRKSSSEEPSSRETPSAEDKLWLQEIEEAREKHRREREHQRYLEALQAQIQEKLQLYGIILPALCYCSPDFWGTHPDTCANNCIFYKNHKAYTRALYSVINSCDIPEGHGALRMAIHDYIFAYMQKKV